MAERSGEELYVGYLRTPRAHARYLKVVVPVVLGALAGAGAMLARTQADPGPGVWEDGVARSFHGVLAGGPYPVLFMADRGDGRAGPVLVVASGKHGALPRLVALAGGPVTLKGTLLRRGPGRMIELDDDEGAASAAAGGPELPAVAPRGRVTLRGEIVDSKCFLGAMKPGRGKTHKECATLCISGGIPPTLLFQTPDGAGGSCILLGESGGPLDPAAYPFIADPVEVTGELEEQGGLLRLRVRAQDIVRL